MLCKNNMASLDYKSKKNNAKHIFPSFPFFIFYLFIKGIIKKTYYEMHEYYEMQILETTTTKKKKKKSKRTMVTKNIKMKHKNHVKRTQLD